jgi:uncharacterized protein (DUF2126 family)/transglutaminase-like putative cysteine protease
MGTKVALNHRSQYVYGKQVALGPQVIQLRPAPHGRTPILSYSLEVTPANHLLNWQLDPQQNQVARVVSMGKTQEFVVDVDLVAELTPFNPFGFLLEPEVVEYPFAYPSDLIAELGPYLSREPAGPLLQQFLGSLSGERQGTIDFLVRLNRAIRDKVEYQTRLDHGVQICEETLEKQTGSCRDSSWLLVQALRHLGFAARFVSGYLIQLAPDDAKAGDPHDSADLHAWAEAFLPGAGWVGFDPTSGLFAGEGHIPLMCTVTPSRAAPIVGTVELSSVDFSYSMSVRRLEDSRPHSSSITDVEWRRIGEVAKKVDGDLKKQDVRLTMGGEPTFVGLDEPESAQWNIDALGPIKRSRGLSLIRCIRARIAPGAMLLFGQGKWYPGEPLPRWALSCYWRADGVPVWENIDLIAKEDQQLNFKTEDARRFAEALAQRLQVDPKNILPGYNSAEATEPAGYILPLRRRQFESKLFWSSQLWFSPGERLLLTPGDSPVGYRISTESMPWVAPDELEYELDAAPVADRARLSTSPHRRVDLFKTQPVADPLPAIPESADTAEMLIRPSLCVEVRDGRLNVFLPYASQLADYLDLIAAVEDTSSYLKTPVWLEGYAPAADPRLRSFSVTPDPGVLEVNLPPSSDWTELEHIYTLLSEEASKNRLTAEKFNYDGSQASTGGGSHIVLGGATVLDSPFLRRPDLLRSMVTFWQNHPAMSYFFSGLYVGPTSQSPRVDEARMDALYELEVAFGHLPEHDCPPEVVDGFFRNLLVDVTGNSHRAEFCVDKLYPPPGLGSRLGLLELRAFEMTPHVRMGLLQMLLIRAVVAAVWARPYSKPFIRWGTALHDRFMLPHFVGLDLSEVLDELRGGGYDLDPRWFSAQMEFRFPKIGSIASNEVELELRHALEPWNVLAEETASGRTVRTVDSSLERMQVKLSGLPEESRYLVMCNGRKLPMRPTGRPGEMIAGLRYRARQLSASLHPTVPVNVPLVFELVDIQKAQMVGRCTYHATALDGQVYPNRPASAAAAKMRSDARFVVSSPDDGPITIPPDEINTSFPGTLDLRMPQQSRFTRILP